MKTTDVAVFAALCPAVLGFVPPSRPAVSGVRPGIAPLHVSFIGNQVERVTNLFSNTFVNPPTSLPQDADDQDERASTVQKQAAEYQWSYEEVPAGTPYLKRSEGGILEFASENIPAIGWIAQVVSNIVFLTANTFKAEFGADEVLQALLDPKNKGADFLRELSQLFNEDYPDTRPDSIQDYKDLFEAPMEDAKSMVDYGDDLAFARLRLQGPNPAVIGLATDAIRAKLVALDTDASYAGLKSKVDAAMLEGRLYAVDMTAFDGMRDGYLPGPNSDREVPKRVCPSIALFEVTTNAELRERLPIVPIAIQCDVAKEGSPAPPIFTPEDGWAWSIAKACYTSSDGMWHEAISHLGDTHLVVESFVVATQRTLPPQHPLAKLLLPHFEGTALINAGASELLFTETGTVNMLISADIRDVYPVVTAQVIKRMGSDFSFPAELAARKMTKEEFPYPYPYRDYAQPIWDALFAWVTEYLELYYGGTKAEQDKAFAGDYELQAWVDELVGPGKCGWLEEFASSDDKFGLLAKVVASVIYTGSVQHAAVNFPQKPIMSFMPAYPLGVMQGPPTSRSATEEDYLTYLAPMESARQSIVTLRLLGSVHHTVLGDYDMGYFDDERVTAKGGPLRKFQQTLDDINEVIIDMNGDRVAAWKAAGLDKKKAANFAYLELLRANIPQSVNI